MRDKCVKLLATFFYIGYIPVAPGSMASAAGLLLFILFYQSLTAYVVLTAVIVISGFLVSGSMEKISGKTDPSCIVIDEVAGVLIAFFLLPKTTAVLWTGFFLFRAFDMFKIYPVNKFEEIKGGAGVMMDDIIAGVYTNITMHAALRLTQLFH
jgi:phosphatidylglycerophosphatase A